MAQAQAVTGQSVNVALPGKTTAPLKAASLEVAKVSLPAVPQRRGIPDGENPPSRPAPARVIEIEVADLPLACPRLGDPVFFDHPRVYLDILESREALCPYCGTLYRLSSAAHLHDHQFDGLDLHQHRPPLRHEVTEALHHQPAARQPNPAGVVDRFGRTMLEQLTDWLHGIRR